MAVTENLHPSLPTTRQELPEVLFEGPDVKEVIAEVDEEENAVAEVEDSEIALQTTSTDDTSMPDPLTVEECKS